jgi:nitrogen regulatory protein P-II 1
VENSLAKRIVDDVLNATSTGSYYDGRIIVSDIAEAYVIGSKETGDVAL